MGNGYRLCDGKSEWMGGAFGSLWENDNGRRVVDLFAERGLYIGYIYMSSTRVYISKLA